MVRLWGWNLNLQYLYLMIFHPVYLLIQEWWSTLLLISLNIFHCLVDIVKEYCNLNIHSSFRKNNFFNQIYFYHMELITKFVLKCEIFFFTIVRWYTYYQCTVCNNVTYFSYSLWVPVSALAPYFSFFSEPTSLDLRRKLDSVSIIIVVELAWIDNHKQTIKKL